MDVLLETGLNFWIVLSQKTFSKKLKLFKNVPHVGRRNTTIKIIK